MFMLSEKNYHIKHPDKNMVKNLNKIYNINYKLKLKHQINFYE